MEKNLKFKDSGFETELTIGMPTYKDFDGVYFTLQSLRMYQDCNRVEFIVIDNYGCPTTKEFVENWVGNARYIEDKNSHGTAYAKNKIFEEAKGNAVLCMDCHVLLAQDAIKKLKQYYKDNPNCSDLLQGPLLYDDLKNLSTHFDPVWRNEMYGVWSKDNKVYKGKPFEIPMQGMGVFSCKKDAWLGFNKDFKGFGGEEGYIHEKFRQAGRKCLCIPWLKWVHRFGRPNGAAYPLKLEDKIRNYIIGWNELGMDLASIIEHFSDKLTLRKMVDILSESTGKMMDIIIEEADEEYKES